MPKGDHLRKDGYWSGWNDYRYGSSKQIKLASVMPKAERKHVINEIFDVLQDWQKTPFENEGPIRAGIRSAMCLQGDAWAQADFEAATILSAAFKKMGAKRPSYEEGQPNYTLPAENCRWCAMSIPDELMTGKTRSHYCSEVCARSALENRSFEERRTSNKAYANAFLTIQRMKHDAKSCKHCGSLFRPLEADSDFCSHECATASSRKLHERTCKACNARFRPSNAARLYCSFECQAIGRRKADPKACEHCGEMYWRAVGVKHTRFCSKGCADAHKRVVRITRHCRCCGFEYETRSKKSMFCSNSCLLRQRRGKLPARVAPFVPVYAMTTSIFDGWFRRAA